MSTQGMHSCCVAHLALQLCGLKVMLLNANHILSWVSQVMPVVKDLPANADDIKDGLDPWVGKIPGRRKWQLTPAFLPGEFQGRYSLSGHKESDRTE